MRNLFQDTPDENWSDFDDHPKIDLSAYPRSLTGNPWKKSFLGCRTDRWTYFSNPSIDELCTKDNLEIFFLALPHGTAASYAINYWRKRKPSIYPLIFDSTQPKLTMNSREEHPAKNSCSSPIGLPNFTSLMGKSNLLHPGCYQRASLYHSHPLLSQDW